MVPIVLRLAFVNRVHHSLTLHPNDLPQLLLRVDDPLAAVAGEVDHGRVLQAWGGIVSPERPRLLPASFHPTAASRKATSRAPRFSLTLLRRGQACGNNRLDFDARR